MLCFAMPRAVLSPTQRLLEDLEDALVQADALGFSLVAIRIGEALEELGRREDGQPEWDR